MSRARQRGLFGKTLEAWREEGCGGVVRRVLARTGKHLYKANSGVWLSRDVDAPLKSVSDIAGDFSSVKPADLASWLRQTEGLAWAADERELATAEACAHLWTRWSVGGETVAFCKVGTGRVFVEDFDREVVLPDSIAFISDIYVSRGARRKGIGRALLVATIALLEERGARRVVCHIPPANQASAGLFESVGFGTLGEVRYTRILGVASFSVTPEQLLEKTKPGDTQQ